MPRDATRISDSHKPVWTGAQWIGLAERLPMDQQWQKEIGPGEIKKQFADIIQKPDPQLRKTFVLHAGLRVKIARWDICALGYVEASISGKQIEDCAMNPAVTDFSKRRLILSLDVPPEYFVTGENVLGLWLGRGWYARGLPGVEFDGPVVKAILQLEFDDDTVQSIPTDESWLGREGPIRPLGTYDFAHFVGEELDSKKQNKYWNLPGNEVNDWKSVNRLEPCDVPEILHDCPLTREFETRNFVQWQKQEDGSLLGDLGCCVTGQLEFIANITQIREPIIFEYGDKFKKDGSLQTYNQMDRWLPGDLGRQRFANRFEYHAFRFVRIKGLQDSAQIELARAHLTGTDCKTTGTFSCSDDLLNRICKTVHHTFRCLLQGGVLQDCPHRERLGYGDGQAPIESAIGFFDMQSFLRKWFRDWQDCQDAKTGNIKHTAPSPIASGGGPAWSAAGLYLAKHLDSYYHDSSLTADAFLMARGLLNFLESQMRDGLLCHYGHAQWGFLGDWVAPGKGMQPDQRVDAGSTQFFNNCYMILLLDEGVRLAKKIGDEQRASHWKNLAQSMRLQTHKTWFNAANFSYANGEPTYLVMPLLARVTPDVLVKQVESTLRHRIMHVDHGHINTGMLGTWFMIKLCIERGWNDLIFEMATKKTFPGWGYMLENQATTIWEEWNGDNSQIHSCHLSIGQWFFQGIGGIRDTDLKNNHILLTPAISLPLDWFECGMQTALGKVSTKWQRNKNSGLLHITVPTGASAKLQLPLGATTRDGNSTVELTEGEHQLPITLIEQS